jgi:hypothetical protein
MKKINILGLLLFTGASMYAQTFETNTNGLSLTPESANLGLGASAVNNAKLYSAQVSSTMGTLFNIYALTVNESTAYGEVYGLYSTVYNYRPTAGTAYGGYFSTYSANTTGIVYGIYSNVSGTSGAKKYSGYFTGGDVQVNANVLATDLALGTGNKQWILHTQSHIQDNTQTLFIAPKINDSWVWNKGMEIRNDGSLILPSGKIGIGTTAPQYLLDVKGIIRANEIKVEDIANFPDFVFERDYNLLSLGELDNFIKRNGHLPEIPTAAEVKENGIEISAMHVKLLQKIEELTLYIIVQNEKIEKLETKVNIMP